ncbi:MAG TPA: DMT family transporter [Stellaceae bacterium]|nr:DMT family transporter [Stellaceae bacterium]
MLDGATVRLARLAPVGFVLLWSSSFVATRAGLRYLSPLAFVALRQSLCALVLVGLMLATRSSFSVLAGRWFYCALAGALVNGVMVMAAHWGMVRVGAAPMALVQTLHPLLTALLAGPLLGEWLRVRQWVGLFLGAAGVALIVGLAAATSVPQANRLAVGAGGVLALTAGTILYGRFCRDVPLLAGTAVQFVAASLVCIAATVTLESPRLVWNAVTVASVAWNAGVVSLGGMALYFFMLTHGAAARTTANFYLVPGVTAVMAWLFLGEDLSALTVCGLVVAAIGCRLVGAPQDATAGNWDDAGGSGEAKTTPSAREPAVRKTPAPARHRY